jgi:uncharacterized protein (TIGR02246 family)
MRCALYRRLLESWNARDAAAFAAAFSEDGEVIGFDGSEMAGPAEIATTLQQIFVDHVPATYVSKVPSVRLLRPDVALLRALVGMAPPGQTDLNPAVNAHQTLIAVQHAGAWCITLFQTTPAPCHGRPALIQQMTDDLRQVRALATA